MADFIMDEAAKQSKNPVGVSECLVDPQRRIIQKGLGWTDDSDAISDERLNEVGPKAIPLDLHYPTNPTKTFFTRGYGQCGLIRKGPVSRSPGQSTSFCTVLPVSAKHNFRTVAKDGVTLHPEKAIMDVEVGFGEFLTEDMDWTPTEDDEIDIRKCSESRPAIALWGRDISVGAEISDHKEPLTDPDSAFELVRPNLKVAVGMKVGIAVNFRRKAKPTEESVTGAGRYGPMLEKLARENVSLQDIYGEPERVNVYTGKITFVGTDHIEYDCNSFSSCSGAIVFLLDNNQESPVQRCDHLKAVAVHSGSHPYLPQRNYGFLLRSHPVFAEFK